MGKWRNGRLGGLILISFILILAGSAQGATTWAGQAGLQEASLRPSVQPAIDAATVHSPEANALSQAWTPLPGTLPAALAEFGCAWFDEGGPPSVYNQKVYCLGGWATTLPVRSIYRYDPRDNTWEDTQDNLPVAVAAQAVVLIHDENFGTRGPAIYVIGGRQTLGHSDTVQRYYPRTGHSEVVASDPWPGQVAGSVTLPGGCGAVNDKIYCFGGFGQSSPYFSNATYEYDPARPAGGRWVLLSPTLSPARSHLLVAVRGTVIYAGGGFKGYNPLTQAMDPANNVEALDVGHLELGWQVKPAMPLDMGAGQAWAPAGATLGNAHPWLDKVFTAGGISEWPNISDEGLEYSIGGNAWNQGFPNLNTARSHPAGVFIPLCTPDDPDDAMPALLVAGGWCGPAPCATAEYFPAPCYRPDASFERAPSSGCLPLTVRFTDTSRADPPITEWRWEFGDGTFSDEQHPNHTYYMAGDMHVTLTVTNINGSDVATATILAWPQAVASLSYSPTHGPPPLTVYLTNTSSAAVSPTWAFGDGTYGNGDFVSHTYGISGTYTVALTVTSPYGCGDATITRTVLVGVACRPVTATDFTWDPPVPTVNQGVTFNGVASGTGTIGFAWDWGDGQRGSGQVAGHTYTAGGDYTVTMTATNPCGRQVVQHALHVCAPPHYLAFSWTPDPPAPGRPVTFTAIAHGDPPTEITWDLGDGSSGSGAVVTHTYAAPGNYAVVMTVTNPCGEQSVERLLHVCTPVSEVHMSWSPAAPAAGEEVSFVGSAQGEAPIAFLWSFGDGESGSGRTVSHTYATSGTYGVVMTATNGCGQDVVSGTISVGPRPIESVYLPILFLKAFFGPCESEPNNSPGEANGPLRSGRDYCGQPNDADDYFYFSTLAGNVSVDLTNYQGQGGQLILYDSSFNPIVWDNNPADGYHIEANVAAGRYYIRLYSVGFSSEPYTLRATFVEP